MKIFHPWLLLLACSSMGLADGPWQLLPEVRPQQVFAGNARKITVTWHNAGDHLAQAGIHTRLWQASSATAIPLGEAPWKTLQLLPQQTVLESAALNFPAVRAETKFLVQWLAAKNEVIGTTEVWVYPTNVLEQLRLLAGRDAVGVFDPLDRLKPLLNDLQVPYADLEKTGLEYFTGRLAIIGPFDARAQMPDNLASRIKKLSRKNVAAVWLQPPPAWDDKLAPSFYIVPEKQAAVIVVSADLTASLAASPLAQLNLVYFCQLALKPEPLQLPNLSVQP